MMPQDAEWQISDLRLLLNEMERNNPDTQLYRNNPSLGTAMICYAAFVRSFYSRFSEIVRSEVMEGVTLQRHDAHDRGYPRWNRSRLSPVGNRNVLFVAVQCKDSEAHGDSSGNEQLQNLGHARILSTKMPKTGKRGQL